MFNYGSLNEFIGMLLFWAAGLYVLTRSPLESARTVGDLIVACMKKLEPGDGRPPPLPDPYRSLCRGPNYEGANEHIPDSSKVVLQRATKGRGGDCRRITVNRAPVGLRSGDPGRL